jgi:hypothetical protein
MNKIILLISFLLSFNSNAMEFTRLHKLVKDTVIDAYTMNLGEERLTISEYDIWGIQFAENNSENCDLTMTGVSKRPTFSIDFRFWVCVNNSEYGQTAYLIKDEMIVD